MVSLYNNVRFYQDIRPYRVPVAVIFLLCLLCLCVILHAGLVAGLLPGWSNWTTPLLMSISVLACLVIMPRNFTLGFLLAVLPFLTAWRIGAMYHSIAIMAVCSFTLAVFLLQFFDCAISSMKRPRTGWRDLVQWQMTFLRICFGYDMVGHFTEKLFAGYDSFAFMADVFATSYFISLPPVFVVMGGLCELATAIGIGMGFMTRLAGFGAAFYYLIATVIGSHFLNGYGWVAPGGGWEYCMLMILFFLSFSVSGAGRFSIDGWLLHRGFVPRGLRFLFAPEIAFKKA